MADAEPCTAEEMQVADDLLQKIDAKAHALLEPLAREMRVARWAPEYRSIVWEAVARKAMARAREGSGGR